MPRALVIGGSVGGLMAATLLHRAGWNVAVYERAVGDLAGRGAGLGVSEELLAVMARAGARFDPSAGVMHAAFEWIERDGAVVHRHERPTLSSAWARVYRPLRDALPAGIYRQGMTLERVEEEHDVVVALFADGSRETADLLVAADGALSTVRRQYMPQVQPRYANYVAWRGMVEERDLPAPTIETVSGRIVFCFPPGEMLLCMCAPGAGEDRRPGYRRMYFIWYRPVSAEALPDLFTDAQGRHHGISIPPPLIRPELVRELKAHAHEALPASIAGVVNRTEQPLLQAISDMESPRLTFGRVALLGDAAFAVRPHVAGGASKAALDAACLADSLAQSQGDLADALARYEARQREFGSRLVQHSRYLGADLEGRPTQRDPRRIMRDYGAPHLLHDVDPRKFPPP